MRRRASPRSAKACYEMWAGKGWTAPTVDTGNPRRNPPEYQRKYELWLAYTTVKGEIEKTIGGVGVGYDATKHGRGAAITKDGPRALERLLIRKDDDTAERARHVAAAKRAPKGDAGAGGRGHRTSAAPAGRSRAA